MSETVEVGATGGSRKRLLRTPEEKRRIIRRNSMHMSVTSSLRFQLG
jgi:hypothetical protein